MATTSASTVTRAASNLASSVFAAAFVPAAASTSTSSARSPFPPNHRPNKAELEARLFHAHIRARNRRLRESLGHAGPSSRPSGISPRTSRAAAFSVPAPQAEGDDLPITLYSTAHPKPAPFPFPSSPIAAPSPLTALAHNEPRRTAPSSSLLPTPPETPAFSRPLFPHRRSRFGPARQATHGLRLNILQEDAILTPSQTLSDSFRRTPGAPMQRSGSGAGSYFHLPSNLLTPAIAPPAPAPIGLGIMNVDVGESHAGQYFPSI
ncbi:hypothetical protein C8Q76DRAFT_153613 [Earliella scabrosa]|nr:hypothetical protein C8Q76DRAFT_153613 [Earliella scabrosa]